MAKTILKNVEVLVDGDDLSNYADSVSIPASSDKVEDTGFQQDYRSYQQGLKDADITVSFFQDFDAVDAVLWDLSESGDAFDIQITDLDSPEADPFYATVRLFDYTPLAGSVGEASKTEVTFSNASQNGITRTPPGSGSGSGG